MGLDHAWIQLFILEVVQHANVCFCLCDGVCALGEKCGGGGFRIAFIH